jgi:ATP-dependent DNA helicase RecQ
MTPSTGKTFMPALEGVLLDTARKVWGIDSFRPLQEEAIVAGLAGRDSLVVMPTGGGKSLCYQLPAIMELEGSKASMSQPSNLRPSNTTIVVSPLISLMKDQVDALLSRDIPAAFLNSTQHPKEQDAVEKSLDTGKLALLYVSPERLLQPKFLALLVACKPRAIVIDEAHCISHWGHDFRPDYTRLSRIRQLLPDTPIHAFTATATSKVRDEICAQLQLREPTVLIGDFDRPNLFLSVEHRRHSGKHSMYQLHDWIVATVGKPTPDKPGIIYCSTRKDAHELARALRNQRAELAYPYHAGMTDEERDVTQDRFMNGAIDIVVATIAFGMGIDKRNVRWIAHTVMPSSIEEYHQQIGRAGRDGERADCVIFYDHDDPHTWSERICKDNLPGPIVDGKLCAVSHMEQYCEGDLCRHKALTEHFGQAIDTVPCDACDNCVGDRS